MNLPYQQIKQMIDEVTCSAPKPEKFDGNKIDTCEFLVSLARLWPKPLNEKENAGLEALCRKIAVAGKVWSAYSASWKKIDSAEPLPAFCWSVLIAVLLAYCQPGNDTNENIRGMALKRLNAAFSAIDLAKNFGDVPHLTNLTSVAEDCLKKI